MSLRLVILLLRCKARVPIDLSISEDIGSTPIWQAWLGHISLGSRPLDDAPEEAPFLEMLERVQGLGILISRTTGEESHEDAIERVTAYYLIEY